MTRERMPEQGSWRAVGYLRVSTETQAEHATHEGQRHAIEGYCAERGYAIVGWYQDLGVSGRAVPFAQRDGGAALMRELGADGGDGDASTQGDLARREVAAKQSENDALGVAQACVSGHVPPPPPTGSLGRGRLDALLRDSMAVAATRRAGIVTRAS